MAETNRFSETGVIPLPVGLLVFLAGACSPPGGAGVPGGGSLAVIDVTVIPMDSARTIPHQTVLIRDGVITSITPSTTASVPPDAQEIDGTGRYLIPGLIDAHVHLRDPSELLSYLAHGVTTVVHLSGPSGNVSDVLDLRRRVAGGSMVGPTVYSSGRILDGDPPIFAGVSTVVRNPEAARRVVASQITDGVDLIKVYNNLRTDELRAAVQAAHDQGVTVWGHIPRIQGRDSALQKALAAGLDVIVHGEELFFTLLHRDVESQLDRGTAPRVDSTLIVESIRLVRESGAAVIPNLSFGVMTRAQLDDLAGVWDDPEARFLHPSILDMWREQNPTNRDQLERFSLREQGKTITVRELTRRLHDAGVPLLLGTDASAPGMFPGKSAHIELTELVGAGLTPFQALATGTRGAGEFLGRHIEGAGSFGTIAIGSRADLVLLAGNPLDDIGQAGAIEGVIVRGQWFSKAGLDSLRMSQNNGDQLD
jgi:imidazolonepropionase-like amidohydrolase